MRHITLASLQLVVEDLLTAKLTLLQSFEAGQTAAKRFSAQLKKMKALPIAVKGRPLADELELEDDNHDGFGGAIYHICEAYQRLPNCPPDVKAAAKKVAEVFIPNLGDLNASYEDEAQAAKTRKPYLDSLKAAMNLIPVVGGTLLDWATAYVGSGEKLSELLSHRADAANRKKASALRTQTIGIITRLRGDLVVDQENDPNLPADLDAKLFAYVDMLAAKDAADAAAAKKKAAEKAAKAKGGAAPADPTPDPADPTPDPADPTPDPADPTP